MFKEFLENQVIQTWIAPIITAAIAGLVGLVVNIFRKRREEVRNINRYVAAEERLIEVLRPFFIQELKISKDIIKDARSGIIREFKLKDESFIKMEEIKNIIILDILKTRFIREEDKRILIDNLYNIFDTNPSGVKEYVQYDENKNDNYIGDLNNSVIKVKRYNSAIYLIISIIIFLLTMFLALIKFSPMHALSMDPISYTVFSIMLLIISIILIIAGAPTILDIILTKRKNKIRFMKEKIKQKAEELSKLNKIDL